MVSAELLWKIAEKLGIPTVFCTVLCFAIYFTTSWVANNIAKPVVEKHIQFLDTEQSTMKTIAISSEQQATAITQQAKQMELQTSVLQQMSKTNDAILKTNVEIRNDQRKFPAVAEKLP